jgi:uncharacterized protein (DUF697 family)/tellurite resistance protein
VNDSEKKEVAASLIAAACADGHLGPDERQRIAHFMDDLGGGDVFRAALANPIEPDELGRKLSSPDAKRSAYQLAVLVCQADGVLNDKEHEYLGKLRGALGLSDAAARGLEAEADHWRDPGLPPTSNTPPETDIDRRILQFAMLAGAAELLPQTMASMVVLPLQLRLVYEVGRKNGVTLAQDQVRELAMAFGVGATSQAVESFARRLLGGVARSMGGGLFGGATSAATGALVSFATTYALGHAAQVYYEKGRNLTRADLQQLFEKFQSDAKTLYPKVESEIKSQAEKLDADALLAKVRGL